MKKKNIIAVLVAVVVIIAIVGVTVIGGSPIGEPLFEGQDADPPSRHDGMYDL